jgi:hypothetical protein
MMASVNGDESIVRALLAVGTNIEGRFIFKI